MQTHPDSWDERFLRELVGRLKRREGEEEAPWRDKKTRCERYHEHDEWAPICEGVGGDELVFFVVLLRRDGLMIWQCQHCVDEAEAGEEEGYYCGGVGRTLD